jgi:hypothetical protein
MSHSAHPIDYRRRCCCDAPMSERGNVLAEDDLHSATRHQPDLRACCVQIAILGSLTSPAMSNLPRFGWVPKHRSRGVADRLRGGHGARSPGRGSQLPGEIVVFAWIVSWIPVLIEAPTCTDPIRSEYLNSYFTTNGDLRGSVARSCSLGATHAGVGGPVCPKCARRSGDLEAIGPGRNPRRLSVPALSERRQLGHPL